MNSLGGLPFVACNNNDKMMRKRTLFKLQKFSWNMGLD